MNKTDQQAFEAFSKRRITYKSPEDLAKKIWQAALAHRDAQLAAVTQQRDELVEAVLADKHAHREHALAARIQSARP